MSDDAVVPSETQRAARVAQFVEFNDVFLVKHSVELFEEKGTILRSKDLEVSIKYEPNCPYKFDAGAKMISVKTSFLFELMRKEEGKATPTAALRVEAAFILEYAFSVSNPPSGKELDDHLSAFANVNARFNAWPYFREIVQSSVARMGLPPVVLPVFRVRGPSSKGAPASDGKLSEAPQARRRISRRERG